jgi:hypothetical protein
MTLKIAGILFRNRDQSSIEESVQSFSEYLQDLSLDQYVFIHGIQKTDLGYEQRITLTETSARRLAPEFNTMNIAHMLNLKTAEGREDLTKEILLALMVSPFDWVFRNFETLDSAIKVRENIVRAARLTALDFKTSDAERPEDYWKYHEDTGFIILPGKSLIDGLIKATQPGISGMLYSFSCYRATEYVILLAIAQEAQRANPQFLKALEHQWETKAITAERFREKFLIEYGSVVKPLPIQYYVPGDRVWFKNPDDLSSDIVGFEGSWVFYLGEGMFPNFWKLNKIFTLQDKCLEIYHWRNGIKKDSLGHLYMDELVVEQLVNETKKNPERVKDIMNQMFKLRDPMDIYEQGGCMDATREAARNVLNGTDQINLG